MSKIAAATKRGMCLIDVDIRGDEVYIKLPNDTLIIKLETLRRVINDRNERR